MNFNAVLALLVLKGTITREEADSLVDHLNNKPQSSNIADSIEAVRPLLAAPGAPLPPLSHVGPEQAAEEAAARAASQPPTPPANETATEFPTLPGSNDSTGNDLSYDEMSENAKEQNQTDNPPVPSDDAPKQPADNAGGDSSANADTDTSEHPAKPKSKALASAVNKSTKK